MRLQTQFKKIQFPSLPLALTLRNFKSFGLQYPTGRFGLRSPGLLGIGATRGGIISVTSPGDATRQRGYIIPSLIGPEGLNYTYLTQLPTIMSVTRTSLQIMLCRFDYGKLVKVPMILGEADYVAVSHVWGRADWQILPGVDGDVLASKEKATFITEQLPSIVGKGYFWMDILCIDQRNADARIAVTQHIPVIFRSAQKTIVVRDGAGLQECCAKAMGDYDTWKDGYCPALMIHHSSTHRGCNAVSEGVLTRLWVLQEVILSDNIQFVRCRDSKEKPRVKPISDLAVNHLMHSLLSLAHAWASHEQDRNSDTCAQRNTRRGFLHAFLNNGATSRKLRTGNLTQHNKALDLSIHWSCTRRTSKPRDFILAIMPQQSWYIVPRRAKCMTFGELYLDCCHQAEKNNVNLVTLVTVGRATSSLLDMILTPLPPTDNIPTPTCLGDLVKLFNGPRLVAPSPSNCAPSTIEISAPEVEVQRINGKMKSLEIFQLLHQCISCSEILWGAALCGELYAYGIPYVFEKTWGICLTEEDSQSLDPLMGALIALIITIYDEMEPGKVRGQEFKNKFLIQNILPDYGNCLI